MAASETSMPPADSEPVLATVVRPAANPWQFGLKTLLGLMVVCSIQFALMSYLTVFGGLLAAVIVCFAAFTGLLLWAVLFVPSRSALMEQLDFVGIRLVVAITILLVGTVIAGGGTAIFSTLGNIRMAMALESDLGLRTIRTEVWDKSSTRWGLQIVYVSAGSEAHRAGLRSGEVILPEETITKFYERLQESRGQTIGFEVSAPAVGGSIEKSARRNVTLRVPP